MSEISYLGSYEFIMNYTQNITLITVFLVSFILFKILLNDPVSKEERTRIRKKAEKYLNRYKNIDQDFFNTNNEQEFF